MKNSKPYSALVKKALSGQGRRRPKWLSQLGLPWFTYDLLAEERLKVVPLTYWSLATLYQCDVCKAQGDVKERTQLQYLEAGKKWTERINLDFCPECTVKHLSELKKLVR